MMVLELLVLTSMLAPSLEPGAVFDFSANGNKIVAVGWAKSGAELAVLGTDKKLRIVTDKEAPKGFDLPATPLSMAFAPDGKSLAVGFEDKHVRVFKWPEIQEQYGFEMPSGASCVTFSPTGLQIAAGMNGTGNIVVYDVAEKKVKYTLEEPSNGTNHLLWRNNGQLVASGQGMKTWNLARRRVEGSLPVSWSVAACWIGPRTVVFAGDARPAQADGGKPLSLAVWRLDEFMHEMVANIKEPFTALASTTDNLFFAATSPGVIDVYSSDSLEKVASRVFTDVVSDMSFSSKQDILAVGAASGKVSLFRLKRE